MLKSLHSSHFSLLFLKARKWGFDDIFCAVELDNTVAYTMYKDKLEFEVRNFSHTIQAFLSFPMPTLCTP